MLNYDLTLNRPWSNIRTAHQLIILDFSAVIWKSHQGFKRYRANMKYSHTMFNVEYDLDQHPHCTLTHQNSTRGSKDIEQRRKRAGQTDNRAKNIMSPLFMGEDIMTFSWWLKITYIQVFFSVNDVVAVVVLMPGW